MAASEDANRHLLLDPKYWIPRLRLLESEPCRLIQVRREDLRRPGTEVVELRWKAHDGIRMTALLARSSFHRADQPVQIRLCGDLETCAIDWKAVETGSCDVVFPPPPNRRLVDRVLDVLRLASTVSQVDSVAAETVLFWSGCQTPPDEFVIADMVRECGWI